MRLSLLALSFATGLCATGFCAGLSARADEIRNPTAIFAGLDKITGRIISFDVAMDETVQFGTLQITPRVCLTRPQTEAPLTNSFVEVDEIESAKSLKRIFSGWMFSASPGLHGVEHPVYDVWLKDCKGGKQVVASPPPAAAPAVNAPPPANALPAPPPERKPRRTIKPQEPEEPKVDAPSVEPAPEPPPPANGAEPAPLGPPVEVGAPPGAGAQPPAGVADPGAPPPPKPKKPKKRRPPPADDGLSPGGERLPLEPNGQPRRERLEPVSPGILPRDLF